MHGITPKSIVKEVREVLAAIHKEEAPLGFKEQMSAQEKAERIAALEVEMFKAANALDYEKAIDYRNAIEELKRKKN